MKNTIQFLTYGLALLLISSNCNKNKQADRVLKGRLMVNCTTPYAEKLVKLKGSNGSFCEDENGSTEFYTNADGFFEIHYKFNGNTGLLYAPYKTLENIPIGSKPNLDVGEVNLNGTVNFVIKLHVNNPYTANDTLYYGDYNGGPSSPNKKISGPFVTQVLDTIQNYPFMGYPINYNEVPVKSIPYFINHSSNVKRVEISQNFCSGSSSYAEAVFVIN